MKTAKKVLGLILALSMLLGVAMMTSCNIMSLLNEGSSHENSGSHADTDYGTPENIYVTGGDTNNITINSGEDRTVIAASKALLSAVSLEAKFEKRVYFAGMVINTDKFSQSGSGVIYKLDKERGDAYIITNYHVIYEDSASTVSKISNDISVYLYGMESPEYKISAKFIGGSMQHDLAVLKISASPILISSLASEVTVADSNKVAVLDTVIAIGNPDAEGISATVGHVNVDSEEIVLSISNNTNPVKFRVMRIDNSINQGNSGGGLFNNQGELVGIVNAKNMAGDNMSYAISSTLAKYVVDNIIYHYDGSKAANLVAPNLGITLTAKELYIFFDETTGRVHKCERVAVSEIASGSTAAGYLQVDDIINYITIDGIKYDVTRCFHATECVLNVRAGSDLKYNVTRDGNEIEVSFKITENMLTEMQ